MGFFINFYGNSNATLYVNNNGNVTFTSAQSQYAPQPLSNLGTEVIAPFWADVDTRNPASDVRKIWNRWHGEWPCGVWCDWVNVGYYF